ncbi:MAG: UDP-2,3-diacylglucosamine diphosphatase [Hyphomicrobiales bacterium]|nr:UDP-2,3-diacylglucosamine diphosphatase [Hyphomicrobiales bacterium]MBV8444181.1 UDP-2,3-diacylglucosamine diphosphatase [Hyphomicrobiales bacterium]
MALRPAIPRSIHYSPRLDTPKSTTYNGRRRIASSKRHENLRRDLTLGFLRREAKVSKPHGANRYRTLFLSDLHLGTRGCQAYLILDMLRYVDADTIYLVGDIIDGWRLRSGWYWPQAHNDVVQKLLRKVRRGARMVFVPGNHDEFARQFFGLTFGGIEIKRQTIHTAANGKRYLIIHGDEFDVVVRHSKWLAYFGDWAYTTALFVNTHFNATRRALGLPYWSFSAWAKLKVKNAVNFIGSFEKELAGEAKRRGVDGVVCGHIHHPVIREIDGVTYVNTGDFVESCSLVVEHHDGRFEVLRWPTKLTVAAQVEDNTPFEDEREEARAEAA